MSRSAQDVLEFDKLRELLRLRTTCAPGRRRMTRWSPVTDRSLLENEFALIREANEWLRLGRELGFGALADPFYWLGQLEAPGVVLEAKALAGCGHVAGDGQLVAPAIPRRRAEISVARVTSLHA